MLIDEKSVWNPDFPEACNEIQFGRIITNIIERSVSIFFAVFVTGINLSTVKKEKKKRGFYHNWLQMSISELCCGFRLLLKHFWQSVDK